MDVVLGYHDHKRPGFRDWMKTDGDTLKTSVFAPILDHSPRVWRFELSQLSLSLRESGRILHRSCSKTLSPLHTVFHLHNDYIR